MTWKVQKPVLFAQLRSRLFARGERAFVGLARAAFLFCASTGEAGAVGSVFHSKGGADEICAFLVRHPRTTVKLAQHPMADRSLNYHGFLRTGSTLCCPLPMSIEFRAENEFIGMWYARSSSRSDFMGAVFRRRGSLAWTFRYRFRYYADDKAHHSDDTKNWYECTFSEKLDPSTIRAKVELVIRKSAMVPEFCDLSDATTGIEMMERLGKMPWVHLRLEGVVAKA